MGHERSEWPVVSGQRSQVTLGAKIADPIRVTLSHSLKDLARGGGNCRPFIVIAGLFFVHATSLLAGLLQDLSSARERQDPAEFSWLDDAHLNLAGAALAWAEVPFAKTYDYENSPSSVFDFSTAVASLPFDASVPRMRLDDYQNVTLSGAPGETITLDLRSFVLRDHATFTLAGTATTSFVINITKGFSLAGYSKIVLSGGVQCNNVFFNVVGNEGIVSLRGKSSLTGTLTASQRIVRMRAHTIVYGNVVASKVLLSGAAQIIPPPVASP